jgi:hypothetical protein
LEERLKVSLIGIKDRVASPMGTWKIHSPEWGLGAGEVKPQMPSFKSTLSWWVHELLLCFGISERTSDIPQSARNVSVSFCKLQAMFVCSKRLWMSPPLFVAALFSHSHWIKDNLDQMLLSLTAIFL